MASWIGKMILETVWLVLFALHTVPLAAYIFYMKRVAQKRPWDIKLDSGYEPTVSVIVPTFNEANTIVRKLSNMVEADYPKGKMEIIVVDSASTDDTAKRIQGWMGGHTEIRAKLVSESERRGMVKALNLGLKYANGEIVLKTDADCLWQFDSLRNAVKYMADPLVGSVAGLHIITAHKDTAAVRVERTYREFYRWLRIGESKLYSTVLYEGELMLVKRKLLEDVGGFDEEMGADDVPTALRVIENGHRAITAEDAFFLELTPYTWGERFNQKVRRARHVLQALWKYKYLNFKDKTSFHRLILPMETYIYTINPLFIIPLIFLSMAMVIKYPWLLALTPVLLISKIREFAITHLTNTFIMQLAILKEVKGKEHATWQKIGEIR